MRYSVLMSVYVKEDPDYFNAAVESMLAQTIPPSDFVIVCDGPLTPELDARVDTFKAAYPELFNVIRLEKNNGLGNALRIGLDAAKCEIVARMDTDDIALPDRLERQLAVLTAREDISAIGGQIAEFVDTPEKIENYRIVPTSSEAILAMARSRNPMNHMTVTMRKSHVLAAGSYCDFPFFEDYHLWTRMLASGRHFLNLPDVCVNVRVSSMFNRRTGIDYFRRSREMMKHLLALGMIGRLSYIKNVTVRFIATVVIPKRMLSKIMPLFTRKKKL